MNLVSRALRLFVLACWVLITIAQPGFGQAVTTGSLSGVVMDEQGGVLPGATVAAVHGPTGTTYEAVTQSDGRFSILNVRVGGPYVVTVNLSGFKEQQVDDVNVALGEDRTLAFKLKLAAITETVTVTAESPLLDTARAGTAANVSKETIESLPTVSRALADFARLSPHFNTNALDNGPAVISVAGRNNRYNNIQIDGAVNNDLFGLADSGSPGGQTQTQPISLDAIQELQLVVAHYDVRHGGFSGGGVNAITKSGTNGLKGTAYYFGRTQKWVGSGPDNRAFGKFDDKQYGGSLGGPIARNKAFFFGNIDFGRKSSPSGFSINGSGQRFGRDAEAARFRDILKNKYGYDPGGLDEFTKTTNNNKVFVRADLNFSSQHRLIARHNYIDALNDIGFPSTTQYQFPDNYYRIKDKQNSTVVQLNSTFGKAFNELRFTYQTIRDNRGGPTRFPFVRVRLPDGSRLQAGRENFSTANSLDQDVLELTNDLTLVRGQHTWTFGTHNEFFKFNNLFIRDNFGNYEFSSLDNLEAGFAQAFDYSFAVTGNPKQSAKFKVRQLGVYAGDQWRLASNFTLTYGVRVDVPIFPDSPTRNPAAEQGFGFRTDVTPSGTREWSPRTGFNWDLRRDGKQQVRGGVGLFSGRTPYVWLSNQYGNTGIEFTRLRVFFNTATRVPFVPDPDKQPTSVGSAATNEVDMIDPRYKFPEVIRGNLAYDRDLGFWGLLGTVELLFSKTVKDIGYQNLNLVQTGRRPDGRPVFSRKISAFSDVILLNNTDKGNQWSGSVKVERPFRNRFYLSGSYLYGRAKSVNDGTSSQAASNWGNVWVPGDPNNPPLAISRFDVRHRITLGGTYAIDLPKGVSATVSLFYNGQTGRPYSTTFNNTDINGDGRFFNDLIYVPRNADDVVIVTNGTFAELDAYIGADKSLSKFRGQIVPRNVGRALWTNGLDFRLAVGVPARKTKVELTLDVLNLINVFDHTAGVIEYADFNQITPIRFAGIDPATGKIIYDISTLKSPTFRKFLRDDLRSRWQAQVGARFRF